MELFHIFFWYAVCELYFRLVRFGIGIFRSLKNIAFCKVFCDVFTKNVAFYFFCKQTPRVS